MGYNQPPHVDYYLGEGMTIPPPKPNIQAGPLPLRIGQARPPVAPVGGLFRVGGGRRLQLPFGYRSAGQIIRLRDAFGRVRAEGRPRGGWLDLDRSLPAGVYQLEAHSTR